MNSLRDQNLAKDVYKDPKNAEEIRKLESIEIKDGKLIITAAINAPTRETRPGRRIHPGTEARGKVRPPPMRRPPDKPGRRAPDDAEPDLAPRRRPSRPRHPDSPGMIPFRTCAASLVRGEFDLR